MAFARPLTVLVVAPTLHAGAADAGAVDLVRILTRNGHRVTVVSNGGRLEGDVSAAGAEFIRFDVADFNPIFILRAAFALTRIARERGCDVIHAHGRAAAWAGLIVARMTGATLLTTWYKGYREQYVFKRLYNSAMVRGARVIAVSDGIAELIAERYRVAPERIAVVPASIDLMRFAPAAVSAERLEAIRRAWGVKPDTKVILVVGRMLRRKGHHVVVKAVHRLKERGLKDFVCVFAGEDQGRTRYTGELWDLVSNTKPTTWCALPARSTTCRRLTRPRLSWSRPRSRWKDCSARSSKRRRWRGRSWSRTSRPGPTSCWRRRRWRKTA